MKKLTKIAVVLLSVLVVAPALVFGALAWSLGPNRVGSWFVPAAEGLGVDLWRRYDRPPYRFTDSDRAVLAAAEARIDERRNRPRVLRLLDADGNPVPAGTAVRYRLARHAFGFNNFDTPTPEEDAIWGPHKNKASNIVTWNDVYLDDGEGYDFRKAYAYYPNQWYRAVGLQTVWHNVVWIIDKTEVDGSTELRVPPDLGDLPFDEKRRRVLDWVRRAAVYTDGRYDIVNVHNEPLNHWSNPYGWSQETRRQLLADVIRSFRQHNKTSQIQVSIGAAFDTLDGAETEWTLSWLKASGLPVDRVAMQMWVNGRFNWGEPMPALTLTEISDRLDMFAGVGIPIDVTEFMAPRATSPKPFWTWNPERQTRWAEAVATLCFSHPGVASFSYFRTRNNFMIDGGLLDEGEPTPALARLQALYASWHTEGEAEVGDDGRLEFAGFAGVYEVTPADLPEGSGLVGRHWRVEVPREPTEATADAPIEAIASVVPPAAPESIARLGPFVDASHHLDVRAIAASEPPAGAVEVTDRAMPLRFRGLTNEPLGMSVEDGRVTIGGSRVSGVCFDDVPQDATTLIVDLEVHDRGGRLALDVVDGVRRFVDRDVDPGRVRLAIPVGPDSRPSVRLVPDARDYDRYRDGDTRLPMARLHGAWFVPRPSPG